jgi:hypothetical protein
MVIRWRAATVWGKSAKGWSTFTCTTYTGWRIESVNSSIRPVRSCQHAMNGTLVLVASKTGSASSSAPPKLCSLAPTNKAFRESVKSSLSSYRVAFIRNARSSRTWSGIIWMGERHHFKIITTGHPSKWNSTGPRFHYATYPVWLQEWHPLAVHGFVAA